VVNLNKKNKCRQ